MSDRRLAFVIPARNEEALIGETLEAILTSVARASNVSRKHLWLPDTPFDVIVANDSSEDATADIVGKFADEAGVRLITCVGGTCAAARNAGAAVSFGRVLCFVDADTIVPDNAVHRILQLHESEGRCLVLYRLVSREPGMRAWLWWTFWGLARHLPLARAKSMPAFMSCDRTHFERYGPFNESYSIAEEWPLTIAAYRHHRGRFLYDRRITARTSSRRMELQSFGYLRTFLQWVCVVLFRWARTAPMDQIRHETGNADAGEDAGGEVRAGIGGARLLHPVPGPGAATPIREVLEDADRLPGRGASGAKVSPVLRASPGLDGRSARQDS